MVKQYETFLNALGEENTSAATGIRNQDSQKTRNPCIMTWNKIFTIFTVLVGTAILLSQPQQNSSSSASYPNLGGLKGHSNVNTNNDLPMLGGHHSHHDKPKFTDEKQLFDEFNRYIIDDYDAQRTFSDFLPGVAGIYGKPVWAFYTNRGQGIASFGTKSKSFPIMTFASANHASQNTALLGFRTFIQGYHKGKGGGKPFSIEPFSPTETRYNEDKDSSHLPKRRMFVGLNEVQIQEIDQVHGIETNVTYFILPEENFAALVRRTTFRNLDTKRPLQMSALDGLTRMEPAGGDMRWSLTQMAFLIESFMDVYHGDEDSQTMPFYRLSMEPSDKADVQIQTHGHYCLSFIEGSSGPGTTLPIVYDTAKVFGEDTTLIRPRGLERTSVKQILSEKQHGGARTSSAFAAIDSITVGAGESVTISSFYGKAADITKLPLISDKIKQAGYTSYKQKRGQALIKQITAGVETNTGNNLFNGHVQQMYLDNVLRGGMPVILGDTDSTSIVNADQDPRLKVYHVFSRIHGDMERDYNDFVIEPTFFSQGPGNHRDVAQNRRNDVIFTPRIGAFNVKSFLSFIQADGYEPLEIQSVVFRIPDKDVCNRLAEQAVGYAEEHLDQREALSTLLNSGPFRPGELFELMDKEDIELILKPGEFIDLVAGSAESTPMANYKTGYWGDHWTYNMDLVDSYLAVYPDSEETLLFLEELPYFYSTASVRPRSKKYVLSPNDEDDDDAGFHVRQLNATLQKDKEMKKVKKQYTDNTTDWEDVDANWQRDQEGNIFKSSIIVKLLLLGTIKYATRDPYGMGIEYEGGRPGWNDAMNGLPGMVGSGMPETFELEIMLEFLLQAVSKYNRRLTVPVELKTLIEAITKSMKTLQETDEIQDISEFTTTVPDYLFQYWDEVATARETYRETIRLGFSGETHELTPEDLQLILESWLSEIEKGKARAMTVGTLGDDDDGTFGIMPTYFSFNVTKWIKTGKESEGGDDLVLPLAMEVGTFPMFLEGPVRMMKAGDREEALDIYEKVRHSPLRDEGLGMYKISASLKGQSLEMGRMMAFSSGWLENESVWLHMSYKYYLEMLRQGMFADFFNEMKSGGMLPFMDSEVYGRSPMECSSFIASSALEDPAMHGRGFMARLSGSTAEFLSMWALMFIGPEPFFVNEKTGELRMQLLPALPFWLFQRDDGGAVVDGDQPLSVSFKLFGMIQVTYYNVVEQDLFRVPPSRYVIGLRDGSITDVDGSTIPQALADKLRRVVFADYIDVYFE